MKVASIRFVLGRRCPISRKKPEIAFADLHDDMAVAEAMIKYVINDVLEKCPEEMEFLNSFVDKDLLNRLTKLVNSEFKEVTYTEAVDILCHQPFLEDYPNQAL